MEQESEKVIGCFSDEAAVWKMQDGRVMNVDEQRCSVEINITQFLKNYELVKGCLPCGCKLMAVLKGNAYGHGAAVLAKELESYEGDWIAVASLGEALKIREAGVKKEILILGYTAPEYAGLLAEKDITQALIDDIYAERLKEEARKAGVRIKCHLALDTGMGRIGLLAYGQEREDSLKRAEGMYHTPEFVLGGIFTHFSSAYGLVERDRDFTACQYDRFYRFCEQLKERGIDVGLRHCNNSPSIINYPEYALDMCRGGTLLFGFLDRNEMRRPVDLKMVMRLKTVVAMVKELEPGSPISYGRTFYTQKRTRIAVLSIGWYDGYPRLLGNKGVVLIRGRRYPIVGRVCMDLCMADITGDNEIKQGDEVVVLGTQGQDEIRVTELHKPLGVGPGSIGGGISERVPRIYTR